jgi:opacity protein-like surface antigen
MARRMLWVLAVLVVAAALTAPAARADVAHRIGVGAQYWMTIDDIETDNVDQNGFSYMITYQLRPMWLLKFEFDLEMLPDYYGGYPVDVYAPQAYVVVGGWIYGAAGIGILFSDGEFADAPFYALRAGVNLPILPRVYLDINANYRFQEWDKLENLSEEIDTDTVMLGAAVRVEI